MNALINSLPATSGSPVDNDYYISQYVNGGSSSAIYYRRPIKYLLNYIKGKTDTYYSPTFRNGVGVEYVIDTCLTSANNGKCIYIGKFAVYDTGVFIEIKCSTNKTFYGMLIIACQNNILQEAKVYGDSDNRITPLIYIKTSSKSDPYIEVYIKPDVYSKINISVSMNSGNGYDKSVINSLVDSIPSGCIQPTNASSLMSLDGTTLTIKL